MLRDAAQAENQQMITLEVQLADRTRRAEVRIPRKMTGTELIRICRRQWSLSFDIDYQLYNLRTGRLLLTKDSLSRDQIQNGDTLILQPFPVHGAH
jgi:hypothetical protein